MSITTIELLSRFAVFKDLTDLEVLNPDNPIVLAADSPLNISSEKLQLALDNSLVTEYDEELERLADYACLDDLLEIMQILKNGECPFEWAVKHRNRTLIELHGEIY